MFQDIKYLVNKPANEFGQNTMMFDDSDQFLLIDNAVKEGFITIQYALPSFILEVLC